MNYCVYCGAEIMPEDEKCPECGAEILNQPPAANWSDIKYEVPVRAESEDDESKVMSGVDFFASIILLFVPVVGQLFGLIWALGGCANKNRRNLAKGCLCIQLLGIAILVGGFFLYRYVNPYGADELLNKIEQILISIL